MIRSLSKVGQAINNGSCHRQYVYKAATPTPATAGYFVDMNQTSGQPKYNAFPGSPLTFTPLTGEGNSGIYTGFTEPGKTKYLARWLCLNPNVSANNTSPDQVYLCDYLGFYSLIDCDDTESQVLDNTLSLTRYTDGIGVRIVAIVQAPMVSTASFTINYVDTDNAAQASTFNLIAGANIGVCATGTGTATAANNVTPFWPLSGGSQGVKRITSVQCATGAGGFICLALVKPLAMLQLIELNVPNEMHFGFEGKPLPEIKDGAYLNFLVQRSRTGAGALRSELTFVNI